MRPANIDAGAGSVEEMARIVARIRQRWPDALHAVYGLSGTNCGWQMMSETMGRLLAAGNVAEVFEWGSRVVKLYRSTAAKHTAFREAAIHAGVEAMGLPVSTVWSVQQIIGAGASCLTE